MVEKNVEYKVETPLLIQPCVCTLCICRTVYLQATVRIGWKTFLFRWEKLRIPLEVQIDPKIVHSSFSVYHLSSTLRLSAVDLISHYESWGVWCHTGPLHLSDEQSEGQLSGGPLSPLSGSFADAGSEKHHWGTEDPHRFCQLVSTNVVRLFFCVILLLICYKKTACGD